MCIMKIFLSTQLLTNTFSPCKTVMAKGSLTGVLRSIVETVFLYLMVLTLSITLNALLPVSATIAYSLLSEVITIIPDRLSNNTFSWQTASVVHGPDLRTVPNLIAFAGLCDNGENYRYDIGFYLYYFVW